MTNWRDGGMTAKGNDGGTTTKGNDGGTMTVGLRLRNNDQASLGEG